MGNNTQHHPICIVGGGAAGVFAAICIAEGIPHSKVLLLEKARQFLAKVRISGGGRCNVTHGCFDPKLLVNNYPRGSKALLGPFTRFQPRDMMAWLQQRGVELKIEDDNRVFPCSNDSQTIIDCLLAEAKRCGVEMRNLSAIDGIERNENRYILQLASGEQIACNHLVLTTGSNPKAWEWLTHLGHTIVPPLPSLFTFNMPASPLLELAGVSVADAHVAIPKLNLSQRGPLLLTHWGMSGPAILKLSAWGARKLHEIGYTFELQVNWVPDMSHEELLEALQSCKQRSGARLVVNEPAVPLPRNLWKALVAKSKIPMEMRWATTSKAMLQQLAKELIAGSFDVQGKSTYKEEFVTCGGVSLGDVDFKRMESKCCPHLYFAGEILDIDGITGGFNFQNCWTTAWIAAQAIIASVKSDSDNSNGQGAHK